MKVKRLIKLLKQYDENCMVKIYSSNWGNNVNIGDVFPEQVYDERKYETIVLIEGEMKGL